MQEVLDGVVTAVDGDFAKVRPKRHTECDDCQACQVADLVILASNPKKAAVGQSVHYVQAQTGLLMIAWVLFFQPMLAVFAGIGLGALLAPWLAVPSPIVMAVGAIAFLAVAIVFIRWFDRRFKLNQAHFAKITEIIP